MKQLSLIPIGLALALLSACGAYFPAATTANMQAEHHEGVLPLGTWTDDEEESVIFSDAGEDSDEICFVSNDVIANTAAHVIPVKGGILVIASDIKMASYEPSDEGKKDFPANFIYTLDTSKIPTALNLVNAFASIDKDDELPFATPCEDQRPESLQESNSLFPFCLSEDATAQAIFDWSIAQDSGETIWLTPSEAIKLPNICKPAPE